MNGFGLKVTECHLPVRHRPSTQLAGAYAVLSYGFV